GPGHSGMVRSARTPARCTPSPATAPTRSASPSPTSTAAIHFAGPWSSELRLFTATGQLALTQRIGFGWSMVGLEGIAPGLYFYEVKDSGRLLGSGKLVRVE
ncbi:MAG: hypothetical protein MUC59_02470, partial [Saprospiraceae bacterium]|nr:hypothetical protein [Saprospiraceae bacterium]